MSALGASGRSTCSPEKTPQPAIGWDPIVPKTARQRLQPTHQPVDDAPISEQEQESLLEACRKARLHPIQRKRLIADAAGIPICNVGVVPFTREQYRQAVARLEEYRSRGSNRSVPERDSGDNTTPTGPAAQIAEDSSRWEGSLEQFWAAFYKDCRDLGLELWQAQQVIADATGIPVTELDVSRLTRQHLLQAYKSLENLEKRQIRIPQPSPPPAEPKQKLLPWDAPEMPHKFRLRGSGIPWAEPFQGVQGGIPPWRWAGYWCEEDREDR